MKEVSKVIEIRHREQTSSFYKQNKDFYIDNTARIGSSDSAVLRILDQEELLRVLMPSVIGISSDNPTVNWNKLMRDYFSSLSIIIPDNGKKFEVGFKYTINPTTKFLKDNVNRLKTEHTDIKSDETLAKYVETLNEDQRYLYATPINVTDYIHWKYCLNYSRVANNSEDVHKSPKIKFYMIDQKTIEAAKSKRFDLNTKSMQKFVEVIANTETVDNLLYALCSKVDTYGKPIVTIDITKATSQDKNMALETIRSTNPDLFIATVDDKNIQEKAKVERFVRYGIWKRLDNTTIIVDNDDASIVIGNNIDDAISYMNNPTNKEAVSVYSTKLKGLNK